MTSDYEIKLLIKKECFLIIQRKKTINFYRNYFLSDSECPQTEDPNRNFGSSKQIREKTEKTNHDRLFGATKIPMGVLRLGTLRELFRLKIWDQRRQISDNLDLLRFSE